LIINFQADSSLVGKLVCVGNQIHEYLLNPLFVGVDHLRKPLVELNFKGIAFKFYLVLQNTRDFIDTSVDVEV
jgi:hypothetical protein